jgi:hypothetical protein
MRLRQLDRNGGKDGPIAIAADDLETLIVLARQVASYLRRRAKSVVFVP